MTTLNPAKPIYQRDGARFARVDVNGQAQELAHQFRAREQQAGLPPTSFESVRDIMRGLLRGMNYILVDSDYALRTNRKLQRMMRRDPDVMSPLMQRLLAISLMEWNIVAEDEDDETQVEQAKQIRTVIQHNMRQWHGCVLRLADACWYGPSAVNVIYNRVRQSGQTMIAPTGWRPFHPDSLEFDEWGSAGFKVSQFYEGESVIGHEGRVHMFSDDERQAVVLHMWNQEGPDWQEPREAKYMYAGRGLRDIVYNFWYMKQTALQLWMIWIQRYAMGNRIGHYPSGNDIGKTNMEKALRNLANDVSVLIPSDPQDPDAYKIELLEAEAGRAKIFADLIEGYLAGQIKEMIIGQTATTEATNTGLGSDVGTRHAETFNRIVTYDALALADSLTWEFVKPLALMNFGETPHMPRFEFAIEDVDVEKWMQGVKDFIDLGGCVPMRPVSKRLGIPDAEEGEEVLMGRGEEAGDGFGGGALDFGRVMKRRGEFLRAMKGEDDDGRRET